MESVRSCSFVQHPISSGRLANWLRLRSKCFKLIRPERKDGREVSLLPSNQSSSSKVIPPKTSGTWNMCVISNYLSSILLSKIRRGYLITNKGPNQGTKYQFFCDSGDEPTLQKNQIILSKTVTSAALINFWYLVSAPDLSWNSLPLCCHHDQKVWRGLEWGEEQIQEYLFTWVVIWNIMQYIWGVQLYIHCSMIALKSGFSF